ncbi:ABC transporter permease [Bradyrhizobium prioriisuperbiae]|uniref:ABC transporter permease n=1 Tax=Bradyrhizobium prioriisuperbiae TaxID=2854389 RepID=UPI0028F14B56|nr:ABC transporter permease [Bradyrhizobium prioritasuperba]
MSTIPTSLQGAVARAARPPDRRFWSARWYLPLLLLLLLAGLSLGEPRFLSSLNLLNLSRNVSYLAIASVGQMIVMILGGMDLSIGVVVALSSVTTAIVMNLVAVWWPGYELLAIAVAIGAALTISGFVGFLNGLCVAKTGASAFIVTLGAFSIVNGIAYYVTAGIPIYGMPASFTNGLGRGTAAGIPYSVFAAILLTIVIAAVQRRTRFGRYLYAIGGNPHAARISGLPVIRYTVFAYTLCSLLAGLTGVLLTARVGAGQANLGAEFMLQSIAVAVVAGVSLRGGLGRVEIVFLSAVFITVLANAMNLIRIDSKVQTIVFGVVLLAAVFLDRRKAKGNDHA